MKFAVAITLAAACLSSVLAAGGKEFSYNANGLDWDEVAELCGTGMSQSPIDVRSDMAVPAASQAGDRGVTTFGASTDLNKVNIENTGHGLNTNFDATDFDAVIDTPEGPQSLTPLQFHWHSPSEHSIDGIIYPLEVHLVTITNVTEELAVIGTMYKYGDMNPLLEKLWPTEADDFAFRIKGEEAPEDYLHAKGAKKDINGFEIDVLKDLFPQDTSYFAYRGSLTTPPCSEGVYWHLMKNPVEASVDQVLNFQNVLSETSDGIRTNNRSPMPLNGREIVSFP
mmetsp:Transcript_3782/g.6461  ORF Transcript_3782/g.6461 Transcript_3782/m.6461 type:complete len:282 (-) Transcript_3782:67-912(-)